MVNAKIYFTKTEKENTNKTLCYFNIYGDG